MDIGLLIDGADGMRPAAPRYERHDPFTGKLATRARGRRPWPTSTAAVEAAAAAFPAWSKTGPGERRALLLKAADVMAAQGRRVHPADDRGDRRHRPVGRLQRDARRQHAARSGGDDDADRRARSFRPTSRARSRMAIRQPAGVVRRHRAVERAGHPRHARHRHAARLRQHGGAQGVGDAARRRTG